MRSSGRHSNEMTKSKERKDAGEKKRCVWKGKKKKKEKRKDEDEKRRDADGWRATIESLVPRL